MLRNFKLHRLIEIVVCFIYKMLECTTKFFNHASLKMSRGKFSFEEVVYLLDDECGLAEVIQGLDIDHDTDSDDGDREEADFMTDAGTPELVPSTFLRTDPMQEEEPALQDSMLLLDESLQEPDESSDDQQATESMEYDLSSPFQAESMEYNPTSPESQSDDLSDYSPGNSNCLPFVRGRGKGSRVRGSQRRGRSRARGYRN